MPKLTEAQLEALMDEALANARDVGYWDAVHGAGTSRRQANTTANESRAALRRALLKELAVSKTAGVCR